MNTLLDVPAAWIANNQSLRHMRDVCASEVAEAWQKLTCKATLRPASWSLVYRSDYTLLSFQLWRATRASFDVLQPSVHIKVRYVNPLVSNIVVNVWCTGDLEVDGCTGLVVQE